MEAREEILGRIRTALAGDRTVEKEVPRGYREVEPPGSHVDLFADRVEDYRATVTRVAEPEVEGTIRAVLGDAQRVVVPDGLGWSVDGGVPDDSLGAHDLDRVDAVVTEASLGIATTGTIVLEHGPGQGRRALSLVPDIHVCIVREDQVVPGVPQAVARLDPNRPQTWISGPSATSDIELDRVEGVHGPRNLHVILVSGEPSAARRPSG